MEPRDYLKKEIDQMGALLGLILSELFDLKSKGFAEKSQEMAKQSLKEQLQIDLTTLLQLPVEEMILFLKKQRNFNNNNLSTFAEILWESNEGNSIPNLIPSCLNLLIYLEQNEKDYDLQRHWKIMQLKAILASEKNT